MLIIISRKAKREMRNLNNKQNIIVWNDLTIFLPSAIVCKIATEEVENIVLDFNSKFRQYYGENFNAAYYQLAKYLDAMDRERGGTFSRHYVTDGKMRDILDTTLKASDDPFAEFAKKINGQNILIVDDIISRGQTIQEACRIMQESYSPKSITVLTLLSRLY